MCSFFAADWFLAATCDRAARVAALEDRQPPAREADSGSDSRRSITMTSTTGPGTGRPKAHAQARPSPITAWVERAVTPEGSSTPWRFKVSVAKAANRAHMAQSSDVRPRCPHSGSDGPEDDRAAGSGGGEPPEAAGRGSDRSHPDQTLGRHPIGQFEPCRCQGSGCGPRQSGCGGRVPRSGRSPEHRQHEQRAVTPRQVRA